LPEKIVPDTSIVINGRLSRMIEGGELGECEIIFPIAVLDELQAQASKGRETGFRGLEEIKRIRRLAEERGISIRFSGERPGLEDIKLAKSGRIDALIRDVAKREGGVLYTSDYVQALVAEAEGVPVRYVAPYARVERFSFEEYLRPNMISLHLKAGAPPIGRVLVRGSVKAVKLRKTPCGEDELNRILEEVTAALRMGEEGDLTLLRTDALVIETRAFRISAAKPPFSDSVEVVIQRNPIGDLIREEAIEELVERCVEDALGVLVVNSDNVYAFPLVERVAEGLQARGRIVKIIGYSRRTTTSTPYYGPMDGDLEKTVEYLSLSRPDYVIFDEVRRPRDFKLIHELRSLGMGVVSFAATRDLEGALDRILESLDPYSLHKTINLIALMRCGRPIEFYDVRLSFRAPSGLSSARGPGFVIEVVGDGGPLLEIFEVDGRPVVQDLEEVERRLRDLRSSANRLRRDLRRIDSGLRIEAVHLDRVVFRASRSKIGRLTRMGRRLERILGVAVEFSAG